MDIGSKIREIENKLNSLATAVKSEKTIFFGSSDNVSEGDEYLFEIVSFVEHHAEIKVDFDYLFDLHDQIVVKINGVVKSAYKAVIGHNSIEFDCKLSVGENELSIFLNNGGNALNVSVKAVGFIDKKDYGSRINSLGFPFRRFTSIYNGALKTAMIFYPDGEYERVIFSESCEVFAMTRFSQTEMIVVYGDGRDMTAVVMNTDGSVVSEISFEADAEAFCGGNGDGGGLFYAVEGGAVRSYYFDRGLNLTVVNTGVTGKEVFASTDEDGYIVIGFDGKSNFVVG